MYLACFIWPLNEVRKQRKLWLFRIWKTVSLDADLFYQLIPGPIVEDSVVPLLCGTERLSWHRKIPVSDFHLANILSFVCQLDTGNLSELFVHFTLLSILYLAAFQSLFLCLQYIPYCLLNSRVLLHLFLYTHFSNFFLFSSIKKHAPFKHEYNHI